MCKFENDNAPGFDLVAEALMRYAGDAPATIPQRWDAERKERSTMMQADAAELYSSTSSDARPSVTMLISRSKRQGDPTIRLKQHLWRLLSR